MNTGNQFSKDVRKSGHYLSERLERLDSKQCALLSSLLDAVEQGVEKKLLHAYLELRPREDTASALEQVKNDLLEQLPPSMIPARFTPLTKIPRLPNGKLNRSVLEESRVAISGHDEQDYVAPRNEWEQKLAGIWSDLLLIDRVSVYDNFFEVGGDSIQSIQFVSRAREEGIPITPHDLVSEPTIHRLAEKAKQANQVGAKAKQKRMMFSPGTPGNYILFCDMDEVFDLDRPEVEFRTLTIDAEYGGSTSTEEIASRLVAEWQTKQPAGPYFIWSQYCGATMALEVAQQLRRKGEEVPFLGVVDWQAPTLARSVTHRYTKKAMTLLRRGEVFDLFAKGYQSIRWRLQRMIQRTLLSNDTEEYTYTETTSDYVPKPYDSHVTYFISEEYAKETEGEQSIKDWEEIAVGGVDVIKLNSNRHPTILDLPHRKHLVRAIEKSIAEK